MSRKTPSRPILLICEFFLQTEVHVVGGHDSAAVSGVSTLTPIEPEFTLLAVIQLDGAETETVRPQ